jgi:hypothetical protein
MISKKALLCALCASVVNLPAASPLSPLITPTVLLHNATYHAYAADNTSGILVHTSFDLLHWKPAGLALSNESAGNLSGLRRPHVVFRPTTTPSTSSTTPAPQAKSTSPPQTPPQALSNPSPTAPYSPRKALTTTRFYS